MKGGEEPSKSKRRKTSPNANEDKDYIPITNAAPEGINMDVDDSVMQGIVEQHPTSAELHGESVPSHCRFTHVCQ